MQLTKTPTSKALGKPQQPRSWTTQPLSRNKRTTDWTRTRSRTRKYATTTWSRRRNRRCARNQHTINGWYLWNNIGDISIHDQAIDSIPILDPAAEQEGVFNLLEFSELDDIIFSLVEEIISFTIYVFCMVFRRYILSFRFDLILYF